MATPLILGVGALAAAITGRHLVKTGVIRIGSASAEKWVKGGFKAKMDRNEAIQILGLKYVFDDSLSEHTNLLHLGMVLQCVRRSRMRTVPLCLPTIRTEVDRPTLRVKLTKRRIYWKNWTESIAASV